MVTDGIPPPSRNHRTPTAADTPAATAALSLDPPRATAIQNRCRCSRRPTDGRPGERIAARPARPDLRFRPLTATPLDQALRRPVESAQYTSLVFTRRCTSVGIEVSMGSRGDCFDNAVLESFHASLKKDLIHRQSWPTKAEARTAVFDYIEAFYNRRRRHSLLGMLSPVDYENSSLRDAGTSLAASRLASPNKNLFTTTSTAQAA